MRIFKGIVILFWLGGAAFAQPGWGPDIPVTHYTLIDSTGPYSPRISASYGVLHAVWWEAGTDSLGSYEDVFYSRSTDSGASWSDPIWLSPRDVKTDWGPAVVADSNDIHVVWERINIGISYRRSTDGGLAWCPVDTAVISNAGHPSVALAGDTLYVVGTTGAGGRTLFRQSTDRGVSWLPLRDLGSGWQLSQIVVQRNLVHVFVEYRPTTVEVGYVRSTDGGRTWLPMVMLSSDDTQGSFRPSLAGSDTLNVYALWTDYKYSPYPWTGDLFLRRSTDGGMTWTIEETLTVEHRAVSSDILAQGDTLHVVWEDERVDPGRNFELFYRMSTDRGVSWGSEIRLTYAPRNSYGPSLSCDSNFLHLVWYDYRDDTTGSVLKNVFYKQKTLFPSGVEELPFYVDQRGCVVKISPNPIRGRCEVRVFWARGVNRAVLFDALGRVVRDFTSLASRLGFYEFSWDGRDRNGKEVGSGIYFLRLISDRQSFTTKLVVVR